MAQAIEIARRLVCKAEYEDEEDYMAKVEEVAATIDDALEMMG